MSTLTKILVVVFVVLAMFSAVVFIQHARATADYYSWGRGLQEELQIAHASNQNLQTQLKTIQAALEQTRTEATQQVDQISQRMADMQTQLDLALSDRARGEQTARSLEASLAGLQETLAGRVEMDRLRSEELASARELTQQINERLRQQEMEIQELSLRLEQATRNAQALQEELAARERTGGMEGTLGAIPGASATPGATAAPAAPSVGQVSGTVTAVRGNLASVNIGSADGLMQGTNLIIYRGGNYVGELRVEQVDPNTAAGILTDVQSPVQRGDRVATNL